MAELELYGRLDEQLVDLLDKFTSLVKAARLPEEPAAAGPGSSAVRERRMPGALLEVLAEKTVASGHACLGLVSALKKGAVLSDIDALQANLREVKQGLVAYSAAAEGTLRQVSAEVAELLEELEVYRAADALGAQVSNAST